MNLYKYYNNSEQLVGYEKAIFVIPELAYFHALHSNSPFPEGEDTIATSAKWAYMYAKFVLKAPFPEGEDAIATEADYSYWYALNVLKGRFEKGEQMLKTNSTYWRLYWERFDVK
ncbi:MAG: hypothetical protein ACXW2E_00045 [Nitrososphaeraceae archaeon]